MTHSGSSLEKILSWSLLALMTVVAAAGWIGYRHARNMLGECASRPETCEEVVTPPDGGEGPGTGDRGPLEARGAPVAGKADKPDPQSCLRQPEVQKEIRKQAATLAGDLSLQQVEDFKKDEQGKHLQRRTQFMENCEVASANAVNAYAREADLDEALTVKLHERIEAGIKKQREMFAKVQSGELSQQEARSQGRQLREEGRIGIVELLGEQGSDRFFKVLGEEMHKEFEKQEPPPGP